MANKHVQGAANEAQPKSEAFLTKYRKPIFIAVAAIVIVIAGFFAYKSLFAGPREEKASTALAKGQEYFNN